MNTTTLRRLGFSDGLIRHLLGIDPSPLLEFRCQSPFYWRSSSLADRAIVPLWECGVVVTYYDQSSSYFEQCSLEDSCKPWFRYRSSRAVLARLLIDLYEDDTPEEDLHLVAKLLEFPAIAQLIDEANARTDTAYERWQVAFPLEFDQ